MYQFPFEKLEIWDLSVKLTVKIYQITASFPPEEKFGMTSQLRRAASSVAANIAEGSGRKSTKDKASSLSDFKRLIKSINYFPQFS